MDTIGAVLKNSLISALDLPTREEDPAGESEIEQFARGRGLNYAAVTRRAARGVRCAATPKR